ncbi:ubiquitin thioesterase Otu1p [[Candida] railenensis]|uniref:Ubiquitin thioesterase OTU n=1 Tax=[Candida] railenensis TaxID=45579 RepID=A0A9P0QRW4_9ASCO|nr:ubiquitin thioesterase Otu1p [[Candida] railenensis]
MRFRIKSNIATKVVTVEGTLQNLVDEIKKQGLVQESNYVMSIKYGFPPQSVQLDDKSRDLGSLGIRSGDQLIVETSDSTVQEAEPAVAEVTRKKTEDIPNVFNSDLNSYTILRNVPDDNSCLFNSILYAKFAIRDNEGNLVQEEVSKLRTLVSKAIGENPILYDELVLGRPVDKYREWILKKDSWGGAIEIGIIAQHLNLDIYCLDVESANFIKFENSSSAEEFIVLVYSGIHYDVMARNLILSTKLSDKRKDECVFRKGSPEGKLFLEDCQELCRLLQTKNYSTNTTTFRVRCLECYEILVGEMGASNHGNKTGHYRFGEIKD